MNLDTYFERRKSKIIVQLQKLISINTVSPNEEDAFEELTTYLEESGLEVQRAYIPASTFSHTDFTQDLSHLNAERYNLHSIYRSSLENVSQILLQSHIDTVPITNYPTALDAKYDGQFVYGRGACDAKGNIVMAIEAIRALKTLGINIKHNIYLDIVLEEEIGGGGALGSILNGCDVDEVIILEPTNLEVLIGHRGVLSFSITVYGKPVHMGEAKDGINAIEKMFLIIQHLKKLEHELLIEAQQDELYARWVQPLQLIVGKITGGEWTGSIPERCTVEGNLGFIRPYDIDSVQEKLLDHLQNIDDSWIKNNHKLSFNGLRNETYTLDPDHALPQRLRKITSDFGVDLRLPTAWNVSCDARLYSRLLGVPTVIFGSGDLKDAHTTDEKIDVDMLIKGAKILCHFFGYEE